MLRQLTIALLLSLLLDCNYKLRKGTAIVVSAEKDSITIASDSKSQNFKNDFSVSEFDSDNNKLLRINNKIICISGIAEINGLNIKNILKQYVKPSTKIAEDAMKLTDGLILEYKNVAKKLTPNEIKGLSKIDAHTRILIVGYENKVPNVAEIIVGLSPDFKSGDAVRYIEPTFYKGNGVFPIGTINHIEKRLKDGFKFSRNRLNDLVYLIKLQAKYSMAVDSNVNYVVIKPNNTFSFGRL